MRIRFPGRAGPAPSSMTPSRRKGGPMKPLTTGREAIDHEYSLVYNWRVSQLTRLGIPGPLAELYADRIDWHQVARLVLHGCPPRLALRIVG